MATSRDWAIARLYQPPPTGTTRYLITCAGALDGGLRQGGGKIVWSLIEPTA
jgi:hypothetical protein